MVVQLHYSCEANFDSSDFHYVFGPIFFVSHQLTDFYLLTSNSDKDNKDCWRDSTKPIGLLKKICVLRGWPQPTFKGKGSTLRCYVNGNEYKMKYFGEFLDAQTTITFNLPYPVATGHDWNLSHMIFQRKRKLVVRIQRLSKLLCPDFIPWVPYHFKTSSKIRARLVK